jgi:hypothetical protein
VIAACIDRFALCSQHATIRSFCRPRTAVRVIGALVIVWSIIPIHLVVYYSNITGRCVAQAGTYAFFYAMYSLVVIGILPLFLMILFGVLAWRNLQLIRSRVAPTGAAAQSRQNVQINKRDRDLMKMLSGEVLVYCVTTIPYPINLIYSVSTSSMASSKDAVRVAVESLVGYIITPLLNFMYCCVQFYGKGSFVFDEVCMFALFFSIRILVQQISQGCGQARLLSVRDRRRRRPRYDTGCVSKCSTVVDEN